MLQILLHMLGPKTPARVLLHPRPLALAPLVSAAMTAPRGRRAATLNMNSTLSELDGDAYSVGTSGMDEDEFDPTTDANGWTIAGEIAALSEGRGEGRWVW